MVRTTYREQLKGLVLSGGKGSRLRPFTYTGAKQLVPVANKPVLFYALEQLVACDVREIGIVVGETAEEVQAAVGDGDRFGASVTYIPQPRPLGLAHAVAVAEPFLAGCPFVMFLGDNFILGGIERYVHRFRECADDAQLLLCPVPNPSDFGVAEFVNGRLVRVVEKPAEPPSDLAVTGIYMFDPCVFEAVHAIKPSARGELEITDTIQWLIDRGKAVHAEVIDSPWIDTGKHDDLLSANRLVLEAVEADVRGSVDAGSKIQGRVVLEQGAVLVGSTVDGPAVIGARTRIVHSYIGPYTSIDHDCLIEDSEIAGSVVLEHTVIQGLGHRIEGSLIGRNVELRGDDRKPRGYTLILGDFSRVRVP